MIRSRRYLAHVGNATLGRSATDDYSSSDLTLHAKLTFGTSVCLRDRESGHWQGGFVVADLTNCGYRLKRRSDSHVLRDVFPFEDVEIESLQGLLRRILGSGQGRRKQGPKIAEDWHRSAATEPRSEDLLELASDQHGKFEIIDLTPHSDGVRLQEESWPVASPVAEPTPTISCPSESPDLAQQSATPVQSCLEANPSDPASRFFLDQSGWMTGDVVDAMPAKVQQGEDKPVDSEPPSTQHDDGEQTGDLSAVFRSPQGFQLTLWDLYVQSGTEMVSVPGTVLVIDQEGLTLRRSDGSSGVVAPWQKVESLDASQRVEILSKPAVVVEVTSDIGTHWFAVPTDHPQGLERVIGELASWHAQIGH